MIQGGSTAGDALTINGNIKKQQPKAKWLANKPTFNKKSCGFNVQLFHIKFNVDVVLLFAQPPIIQIFLRITNVDEKEESP
jgi:hypothetical protein